MNAYDYKQFQAEFTKSIRSMCAESHTLTPAGQQKMDFGHPIMGTFRSCNGFYTFCRHPRQLL